MVRRLDVKRLAALQPRELGEAVQQLRTELAEHSDRLALTRQYYERDAARGASEIQLDMQRNLIEDGTEKLEDLTERLRLHEAELARRGLVLPDPPVPEQSGPGGPGGPSGPTSAAAVTAPVPVAAAGIANPDGTPLIGADGSWLRTDEAAIGEYVRVAAELRWEETYRRSMVAEHQAVCHTILTALAAKRRTSVEQERQALARHVEARYRRDFG